MEFDKCKVRGCTAPAMVKGLCLPCYQQARISKLVGKCSKCDEKVYCRGLCRLHYRLSRARRLAASGKRCRVCGDDRIASEGLCRRCYEQARRRKKGICTFGRCHEKAGVGGVCAKHQKGAK